MALFNNSRSTIIRLIFLGIFVIILVQLFNLQIISGKYRQLAMDNAVFPKVKYPDRGIIFDRKGRAILNNTIMFDLMVTPNEARRIDTLALCDILGIDTATYNKRMLEVRFKNGPYRPSIFQDLLTPELHARLDENIWKFPGFALVERPVRVYPFNAAAHILGYIGEADSAIIRRSGGFYRMGDYVGRSGLEAYYEKILMGQRGVEHLIKDNKNRLVGSYENGIYDTAAIAGRNLRTYIDMDLQQLAEKLINNKVGAVVAIDPKTGGILAMASGPTYDPNSLTGPNKQKNYGQLTLDVAGPLLNRATNGYYEPGSTFKPLGALVALDEGVITPSYGYACPGRYYGCGHGKPACTHSNPGHAANLRLAIANSCNSYFVQVYRNAVDNPRLGGVKKGYEKWREYMNAFGLGKTTGVDLTGEKGGLIPDTNRYNAVYRGSWNSCTNLTLGIGQDMMQSTPLQLANAMCIIANKGFYYTPHFVQSIDGQTAADTILDPYKEKHEVLTKISEDAYEAVMTGMQEVIEGTSSRAKVPGITVCGKTGTAEKFRIIEGRKIKLENNSVFVCFAPREDPKIALCVIVENSGYGNTWAAPIAGLMLERYLKDSLPAERLKEVDRIKNSSLMPSYMRYLQYLEDSTRAYRWLNQYKDSSMLRRFRQSNPVRPSFPRSKDGKTAAVIHRIEGALDPRLIQKPIIG
ncbi:MAG: penicillin-binding protein 2 [Candidatus Pseudobacter hemicellulosilyticus]|uniref:Penicillin-binding protein 2 n=1 Tax=Candidatus Pseudobacter hemicellulosilyticus TaxID=3121375 RepID=A0AAJ6BHM3_9BACT|nr:MAG: penicillin-binding protein 2 [Pseudobacter sp.]